MDEQQLNDIVTMLTAYGLRIVGAVIILILGWLAAGWVGRYTRHLLSRTGRVDATITGFLSHLVRYTILAFVIIAVLNQFGVQTTSLIALLGAAGLAVGLALQGTLSNLAAGVMLLMFRPFRVGQYVQVAGHSGTVAEINLFVTELTTVDNVQIIIPNSATWGSAVVNYSHHDTRRLDLSVGISYRDDIEAAMTVLRELITGDGRTFDEPEPQFLVTALGESAVEVTVRVWTSAADYWPLKFELTRAIKERLQREGITIPFPQREVHVFQAG